MKKNKVEVFKNSKGKWQWRIRWSNGEIGSHSEVYTRCYGARKSAKKLYSYLNKLFWDFWILK